VGSAIDVTDYQPIRDYCRSLKNRHTRETQKYKGDCCDEVFFKIVFEGSRGNRTTMLCRLHGGSRCHRLTHYRGL